MASRYLKGILKGKKPPKKPTSEAILKKRRKLYGDYPTAKSARGILSSGAFLSRKRVLGGAKAALRKAPKKPGYIEGAITGATAATASALYLKNKKARKDAQAKDDKALKKAMEEHKKKTEAKRKKYGKHHG